MELKPLLIGRVLHVLLWLGLGAVAVGYLLDSPDRTAVAYLAVGVCVAVSLYLAVRAYRMGVRYGPEEIEVRGFVLSRRIPKAQVTQITEFPAVRWKTRAGKARWSPIFSFFSLDGMAPFVARHNQQCIERLQGWDGHPRLSARRNPGKRRRRR